MTFIHLLFRRIKAQNTTPTGQDVPEPHQNHAIAAPRQITNVTDPPPPASKNREPHPSIPATTSSTLPQAIENPSKGKTHPADDSHASSNRRSPPPSAHKQPHHAFPGPNDTSTPASRAPVIFSLDDPPPYTSAPATPPLPIASTIPVPSGSPGQLVASHPRQLSSIGRNEHRSYCAAKRALKSEWKEEKRVLRAGWKESERELRKRGVGRGCCGRGDRERERLREAWVRERREMKEGWKRERRELRASWKGWGCSKC